MFLMFFFSESEVEDPGKTKDTDETENFTTETPLNKQNLIFY